MTESSSTFGLRSLFHLLEGWCEGDQALRRLRFIGEKVDGRLLYCVSLYYPILKGLYYLCGNWARHISVKCSKLSAGFGLVDLTRLDAFLRPDHHRNREGPLPYLPNPI